MVLRMRLHDREPIGLALRRFRKLLTLHGLLWERRKRSHYISETAYRRAKRFRKRLKARLATLRAQQAGLQPVASLVQATEKFHRRTGKP